MMRLVWVLALVAGCDLYYAGQPSAGGGGGGPPPDAAAVTGCEATICPAGTECVLSHGREGWAPACVTPTVAGSCTGPTACDIAVECPQGTTPGIHGICYTPYCIPLDECPPPPPT